MFHVKKHQEEREEQEAHARPSSYQRVSYSLYFNINKCLGSTM